MTTYRLFWILLKAICRGYGQSPVYFDTEARKFEYHMAKVGRAYCEDSQIGDGFWIILHEEW
jgi:hypothetical protein